MPGSSKHGGPDNDRVVVKVAHSADPEDMLDRLQLGPVRTTLVVNGGTSKFSGERATDIANALRAAIVELGNWPAPAILTGGTDAGIFHLLGQVVADANFAGPVIGIVPAGKVDVDDRDESGAQEVEPHHTHVVAVEGGDWGDETPVMLRLAAALARRGPVAVIVAGGGDNARREVAGHESAGRNVVILGGTGRLSDELASDDVPTRAVFDVSDGDGLARHLRSIFDSR